MTLMNKYRGFDRREGSCTDLPQLVIILSVLTGRTEDPCGGRIAADAIPVNDLRD